MKRFFILGVSGLVFGAACLAGLPFMPDVSAPPPCVPVYPAGYSNNLAIADAAARKCSSLTNMSRLTHEQRNALINLWVNEYRANGIPEELRRNSRIIFPRGAGMHRGGRGRSRAEAAVNRLG